MLKFGKASKHIALQMARYSKDMPLTVTWCHLVTWTSFGARQKQRLVAANWNEFFTLTEMASCSLQEEQRTECEITGHHIYRGDIN